MIRLHDIVWLMPTEPLSLILNGYMMLFGFWLVAPWDVFTQPGTVVATRVYSVLDGIADEFAWGAVSLVLGGGMLALLMAGGSSPRTPLFVVLRLAMAFCRCVFWLAVFWGTTIPTTGTGLSTPNYFLPLIVALWVLLRHAASLRRDLAWS